MLTFEQARDIGFRACINKIGFDLCNKYKDTIAYACGKTIENGLLYCFVGVSNKKVDEKYLLSEKKYPYSSSCYVNVETRDIQFD